MENIENSSEIQKQMAEINDRLQEAAHAYYNEDHEIMSNFEYDALYDELVALENEYGVLLKDSMTQQVGSSVEEQGDTSNGSGLAKVEHDEPMLSLDKTKSREKLAEWLGERDGCLSWKLDGSTVVVTYENGALAQAVTRGNGRIGEDITVQARKFANMPEHITYAGRLVVRGEALMTYSEFERINAEIDDVASKYKNPRNLASGTMRALDPRVLDEREVIFCPFTVVSMSDDGAQMHEAGWCANSYCDRLDWLEDLGFSPVEHFLVEADDLGDAISKLEASVEDQDVPSDGLVLFFDDVEYGDSLGSTSHAPKNGIAFKWADETASTRLMDIVWHPSRTGRINPVAVFEPVQLEGTTVERATLNNVTFIEEMLGTPWRNQAIEVYKANKIIPCIVSAEHDMPHGSDVLEAPSMCPSCESPTRLARDRDSTFLVCDNPECPAKSAGAFEHFGSRDALDIRGLSTETLCKLAEAGIVSSFADILDLPNKHDEIVGHIEGMGEKSFENLSGAVERAKKTTAARFLYALGIREIGRSASSDIAKSFGNSIEDVLAAGAAGESDRFEAIDGVGQIMAREICEYLQHNETMVRDLLERVEITDTGAVEKVTDNEFIAGKVFVVTGDVHVFPKRDELKAYVTANGGKMTGSVSSKTDYLITNSPESGTSKNAKARELGVAIITEDEFCDMAGYAR